MTTPGWYLRRLSRMGPREIAGRATDTVRKRRWRGLLDEPPAATWLPDRKFPAVLGDEAVAAVDPDAAKRVLATADRLMDGYAEYFGVVRDDLVSPDWCHDPRTGRSAPAEAYAFDIPYRDEQAVGDVKQIWEPSRHQHLTVLAAAFALSGDERYASRVAEHLKSWWAANPPLRGVHWVSGIELGIRLLSWVWVRRLLDRWPDAPALFEDNPEALHQIWFHQRWLAAFPSRGSSANNHVIAEAAGQLAAACAFGWFPESPRWRAEATRSLDEHLRGNTFGSGLNRELATEYHGLVLELGLAAAVEADAAGAPVPDSTWLTLLRMTDALAAIVDTRLRPPRQGDADDGHGLVLDGTGTDRWGSLLATGGVLFGRTGWWPTAAGTDVRTPLLTSLATEGLRVHTARPARRPAHFADAGLTVLRAPGEEASGEIWCRCDGGPHGFLAIAAHAHADALSLEVRHEGVDVLADPGTFCYHGEPEWRSYFRSTLGHNTLELDGRDQSTSGGPFLWTRHARSRVVVAHAPEDGIARWSGEHDGYSRRRRAAVHRRSVRLDPAERELRVVDEVRGPGRHPCRLAFHLGPRITAELTGHTALLSWTDGGTERGAVLELPAELSWTAHRGRTDPPLGWYSPGFGRKVPACTLLGSGQAGIDPLTTVLRFGT
ncbi:alginate lyase family protein [Qaidamihabitans albus]|uniref:alginate lyase family protein n=1 Tax=Qaidamihabitans albus TaxID=2795733 RepID=UPI0018F18A45|nr:alginate lyase family protein [Qaidamihabitans albus]